MYNVPPNFRYRDYRVPSTFHMEYRDIAILRIVCLILTDSDNPDAGTPSSKTPRKVEGVIADTTNHWREVGSNHKNSRPIVAKVILIFHQYTPKELSTYCLGQFDRILGQVPIFL